jgi:serine/threonine protein kinase
MANRKKQATHPLFVEIEVINRTETSRAILAREVRTRKLAVLKIAQMERENKKLDLQDTEHNQSAIKNEAIIGESLMRGDSHTALPTILPVTRDGRYYTADRETGANYLAEPYYAGFTLADQINRRVYGWKLFVFLVRSVNLMLLRFFCRWITTPPQRNMLRSFGVPDGLVTPSSKIVSGNPLPVHEAVMYTRQIADCLCYLHNTCGYAHLDLKPSNVMFKQLRWPGCESARGLVVIDLGVAQKLGKQVRGRTLPWAPLEQGEVTKNGLLAHMSMDVYALGKILGYLLTGIDPRDQNGAGGIGYKFPFVFAWHLSQQKKKLVAIRLAELIANCCAEAPWQRPTAQKIFDQLTEIEHIVRPRWRRWWLAVAPPLFLALFLALIGQSLPSCGSESQRAGWQSLLCRIASSSASPAPVATPTDASNAQRSLVTTITPTVVPTTMASVMALVMPTDIPTQTPVTSETAVNTPTPINTSTPIPRSTPQTTAANAPPVSIEIVNEAEPGVQSCNNVGSWSTTGPVKIAFRLSRNLQPGEKIEIRVEGITVHSGSRDNFSDGFQRKTLYDTYEGIIPNAQRLSDGQFAWDFRMNTLYQWQIVIINPVTQVQSGAGPLCEFTFTQ